MNAHHRQPERRRRRLGQHFLNSPSIASGMAEAAGISGDDTVLEIGTGRGILTSALCRNAKRVISMEKDPELYAEAARRLRAPNLDLVNADGFKTDREFSIFVSSLPYSESRTAIEWLCQKRFLRAVIMVQKEFAEKLLEKDRAVSTVANHCFEIERVLRVGRNNFEPAPEVDSVVLRLTQRHTLSRRLIKNINLLFSYRRKTVSNVMGIFGVENTVQKRLGDLDGDQIVRLGGQIGRR